MRPIPEICRDEVLRYLGYQGQTLDDSLLKVIEECEEFVLSHAKPIYVSRKFKCEAVDGGISVLGTNIILPGNDIKEHLNGCNQLVLFAATLSHEVERYINITTFRTKYKAVNYI